jgi:hypothetical protein
MPSLELDGRQRRGLSDALGAAFPSVARLRRLIDYRLDRRLDDITLGEDFQAVRFEVIVAAQAEGWTSELVIAAREENPGNADLLAFTQDVGLSAGTPAQERIIREASPMFDIAAFRVGLAEVEGRVCRIEIPTPHGTGYGTGFLVGPNVIMTNHHVVEPLISGEATPDQAVARFDYKAVGGQVIQEGTAVRFDAGGWLVDDSPMSPVDIQPEPRTAEPGADQLDYALVRVATAPGSEPIGKGDDQSPLRGWVAMSRQPAAPAPGSPLLIVQHPSALPLKLAMEMAGVIETRYGETRLRHRVNTEPGSSGSPCFNSAWQLVGLHHVGDPNYQPGHAPEYNEAISINAILDLLEGRGKLQALTEGVTP